MTRHGHLTCILIERIACTFILFDAIFEAWPSAILHRRYITSSHISGRDLIQLYHQPELRPLAQHYIMVFMQGEPIKELLADIDRSFTLNGMSRRVIDK